MPKEISLKDFNEKAEQALKHMVEYGTEITKKAQGNTEVEKQIKDFIKKNIDVLMEQTKNIQVNKICLFMIKNTKKKNSIGFFLDHFVITVLFYMILG